MPAPLNGLKAAFASGKMQIGLWLGIGSPLTAELAAGVGFDWCLIDGEHAPYDIMAIRTQLAAMAGRDAHPVVRVPAGEDWMLKQVLDLGAQSVMVPMVDTAAQALAIVRATRYPPQGIRGMGASLGRAADFGGVRDYVATADAQICVMLQLESAEALRNIEAIAAIDGADVLFIGPADLSADMGYPGQPDAPEVVAAIEDAITRIQAAGKVAGILTFDPAKTAYYRDLGVGFLGVGADVAVLAQGLRQLAKVTRAEV